MPDFQMMPGRDCLQPKHLMLIPWHRGFEKTPEMETHLQSPNILVSKQQIFPSRTWWFPEEQVSWMYEMQRIVFYLFWHFHTAPQITFYPHRIRVAGQSVCCQPRPDIHWARCVAIQVPLSLLRNTITQKVKNHCSALLFLNYRIN